VKMGAREPMAVDLSIIIVNYNSAEYVCTCIKTIYEQTKATRFQIIVVDNASYDACKKRLADEFPEVLFIQSHQNLGFGKANNMGAKYTAGKVLLFLNPDTEIKEHAIDRLYAIFSTLEDPGSVGCRLLNSDGTFQKSCVQALPTVLNQILDADALMQLYPKSKLWGKAGLLKIGNGPVKVETVSGACLMIRKEVYDKVGGFSPDYFMYAEDRDLCFKTGSIGLNNYYVDDAIIVHHGGGSTNRVVSNFSNVMMRESTSKFLLKSRGPLYSFCYRVGLCCAAVFRLAILILLRPKCLARGKLDKNNEPLRKWFGILRWGLGFERWIRKYNQAEKADTACRLNLIQ
jgi:GT2 family glycosyltransferase